MEKLFSWLQCQQECYGAVVSWVSILLFLIGCSVVLALLFALVGFTMWLSPYLALGLCASVIGYLILTQR